MRVRFDKLEITDFKAFKGQHILDLNLAGVTYLLGENREIERLYGNGAAKSSLWDALIWCLYGRTPLGLRNNDVKPWKGGKPSVAVSGVVDNKPFVVKRSTSPNRFTLDGEDIADIETTLFNIGFELFVNTILLPQGRLLFLDQTPSNKMALFSEVLTLHRWDERSTAAAKTVADLEVELVRYGQELSSVGGSIEEVDRLLVSTRKQSSDWVAENQKQVVAAKKETESIKKLLASKQKALATAQLAEDGALTELKFTEGKLRKLRTEQADFQSSISSLNGQISFSQVQVASLDKRMTNLVETQLCHACGQSIKAKDLPKHKTDMDKDRLTCLAIITAANKRKVKLEEKRQEVDAEIAIHEKAVTDFDSRARDAGDAIVRLRPEVAELTARLRSLTGARDEENPYLTQVADLKARRSRLIDEERAIKLDIAGTNQELEQTRPWIKLFKDIKLQLISEALSELELVTNSMLDEVGLEGWQVLFGIDRESKTGNITSMINVQIISPESGDAPVKWESFSGGERQRLRLVGSLALADVLLSHAGIETNLEVLDEPAVYWSSEGVQELTAFLATRARELDKSIFLIEHSAIESVSFDRTITVIKDAAGARLES